MPQDLTNVQLPQITLEAIEQQIADNYAYQLAQLEVQELSELADNIGTFSAGEIRLGNHILPGSGFSGLRLAYPAEILTYNSQTWNLVGIENDVLQAGIRASDGRLVAGAERVGIDSIGIKLEADTDAIIGWYTDITDDYADRLSDIRYNVTELSFRTYEASSIVSFVIRMSDDANGGELEFKEHSTEFHQYLTWTNTGLDNSKVFLMMNKSAGETVRIVGKESASHTDLPETFFNNLEFDLDFRVATSGESASFFVEGSSGKTGLGTNAPNERLDVRGNITLTGFLNLGIPTELTIASGIVTVTQSSHQIDTQSDDATDDLDTINGGTTGDILILRSVDAARVPRLRDGAGNLGLEGNFTMSHPQDVIILLFLGTTWIELSRSNNA